MIDWNSKQLAKLRSSVSNRLKSKRTNADIEEITGRVLLLCLEKGYAPSSKLINNVIIDWRRHKSVELAGEYTFLKLQAKNPSIESVQLFVQELIQSTELTATEQAALWENFWNGGTEQKIELKSALLKLFIQARKGS